MIYQTHTLLNGLRIVHLPTTSDVAYCGFAINVGTRDEAVSQYGMAHFVEHMIFKGTTKRKSWHILNRMENVGGELNAYTAKEETLIYSVFLEKHILRAIELLSDLVVNSRFPENELKREVEVILDEINSYKDNPAELIYDEFENYLFSGNQLGHNILGNENDLLSFTPEMGCNFLKAQYQPGNMVFFSMGKTDFKIIVKAIEKYMGSIPSSHNNNNRFFSTTYSPFDRQERLDTFQAHAIIGGYGYPMFDKKRTTLFLLNNLLGGPGMNSRLNVSLREKKGYVYNVESSFTSYTDTGVFTIYFGTDPKKIDKCKHLIYKELKNLRDHQLSDSQLTAVKKQLMGQIGVGSDNFESIALGLGKSFLHFNKYDSLSETCFRLERITKKDILDVANEIFDEKNLSTLIYS